MCLEIYTGMNSVTQISKLETINNQIASQEIEAGRKKGSVNLIAVSKTSPWIK